MRKRLSLPLFFSAVATLLLLLIVPGQAQTVTFTVTPPEKRLKIRPKTVMTRPRLLKLKEEPPSDIRLAPADGNSLRYGTISLGPNDAPTPFSLALTQGQTPRLLIDANHNGDLRDDPEVPTTTQTDTDASGRKWTRYFAEASLPVKYGDQTHPLSVAFQWYDRETGERVRAADTLLCSLPVTRFGEVKLGVKTYRAALADGMTTGDFRGAAGSPASGVYLLLDVNGNEMFDARGEAFDTGLPFTLNGVTYEIEKMDTAGESLTIVKSKKTAPEIAPPPDLRPGKPVVPFTAKTLDGKTLKFPDDYKGRPTLLLFWASWCGDCQREAAKLVEISRKYRDRGFTIVGVSLDRPNGQKELTDYLKANLMDWPQIYDGKFWDAALAQRYGVTSIPTGYLVDETGKVLIEGVELGMKDVYTTLDTLIKK